MSTNFDQVSYWRDRHEKLRGDHRATGNISGSHEEMLRRKIYQAYLFSALASMLRTAVLKNKDSTTILDIGFGTGFLASILTNTGFVYTGFDLSPIAVEDSSLLAPKANLQVGNIVTDTLPTSDIIFASEVLFHIVNDASWHMAISNISKAMHLNSILIFTETFVSEIGKHPPHFRARTKAMYEDAFEKVGLRFARNLAVLTMPVFSQNTTFRKSVHLVEKA